MDSENLISTLEQSLRQTRNAQTRLMGRLREVEGEAERLRQEIEAMDNSASQTEAAIFSLLATMRSGSPTWNTNKNFDSDGSYDLPQDIQRQKQNMNNYNRDDYSNYNNRDDYNRGSVSYMNQQPRHIPSINPQREPISHRFENKTITEACSLLMREAGEPLHVNELYNMLVTGGMIFTGNNPTISIAVSLNRNKRFKKVAPGTFDLVMKEVPKKAS